MKPVISIIVPVYNEEDLIRELCTRIERSLAKFNEEYEIIIVNDGSTDGSLQHLLDYRSKNPKFKILNLSRNFGHQAAIWAGLNHCSGEYIGIMDGDLQDPPELFEKFYEKVKDGYDVVYAVRKKRKESIFKRAAYSMFYRIMQNSSKTKMPLHSGDFSFFTRQVLDQMLSFKERNPYIRGFRAWVGFEQYSFEYNRDGRASGEVKYTMAKLQKLAYDGFFGFNDLPIRLMGRLGLFIIFGCLLYAIYILTKLFFIGSVPEGFTTIILAIMFFGGVQLFSLRVIGEYVHRIFDETRQRPIYIVKEFHD